MWSSYTLPKYDSTKKAKLKHIENKKKLVEMCYNDSNSNYCEYVYMKHIRNSLLTEGTRISEDATRVIMSRLMPNSIGYNDFMECNNLARAVEYVNSLVGQGKMLDYQELLNIHYILSSGLKDPRYCGKIRDCRNFIGTNYQTAQINQIDKLIRGLFETISKIDNPIVKAAYFSYNLVSIHPFIDYNGRLSRLCESYILMSYGYPIIYLEEKDISDYMKIIRTGQENADSVNWKYIDLVMNKVNERLDEMLGT